MKDVGNSTLKGDIREGERPGRVVGKSILAWQAVGRASGCGVGFVGTSQNGSCIPITSLTLVGPDDQLAFCAGANGQGDGLQISAGFELDRLSGEQTKPQGGSL